jgi:hypothetical protein
VRRLGLALLVAAALVAPGTRARADVYRWVDESGGVHFATELDAVPGEYRDSAQRIEKPAEPRRARRAAPQQPPPSAVAPDTPAAEPAPTPQTPAPPATPPGPPNARPLPPDDPRAAEVAALEAQIARDRETLRQMISTPRWDSSELAKDPQIREIADRLPRLQAELEALRREPAP